jgi:hypothetical protein
MAQKTPVTALTVGLSGTWTSSTYFDLSDMQALWTNTLKLHYLAGAYFAFKRRLAYNISILSSNHLVYTNLSTLTLTKKAYPAFSLKSNMKKNKKSTIKLQSLVLKRLSSKKVKKLGLQTQVLAAYNVKKTTIGFRGQPRWWRSSAAMAAVSRINKPKLLSMFSRQILAPLNLQTRGSFAAQYLKFLFLKKYQRKQSVFVRALLAVRAKRRRRRWRSVVKKQQLMNSAHWSKLTLGRSLILPVRQQQTVFKISNALKGGNLRRLEKFSNQKRTFTTFSWVNSYSKGKLQRVNPILSKSSTNFNAVKLLSATSVRRLQRKLNRHQALFKTRQLLNSKLLNIKKKVLNGKKVFLSQKKVQASNKLVLEKFASKYTEANYILSKFQTLVPSKYLYQRWRKARLSFFYFDRRRLKRKQKKTRSVMQRTELWRSLYYRKLRRVRRVQRKALQLSILKTAMENTAAFPVRLNVRHYNCRLGFYQAVKYRAVFSRWAKKRYFLPTLVVVLLALMRGSALLVVNWLKRLLKWSKTHSSILFCVGALFKYFLTNSESHRMLEDMVCGGVRLEVCGKIDGIDRAKTFRFQVGAIPTSGFSAPLDVEYAVCTTIYGALGVHLWFYMKPLYPAYNVLDYSTVKKINGEQEAFLTVTEGKGAWFKKVEEKK